MLQGVALAQQEKGKEMTHQHKGGALGTLAQPQHPPPTWISCPCLLPYPEDQGEVSEPLALGVKFWSARKCSKSDK